MILNPIFVSRYEETLNIFKTGSQYNCDMGHTLFYFKFLYAENSPLRSQ